MRGRTRFEPRANPPHAELRGYPLFSRAASQQRRPSEFMRIGVAAGTGFAGVGSCVIRRTRRTRLQPGFGGSASRCEPRPSCFANSCARQSGRSGQPENSAPLNPGPTNRARTKRVPSPKR